MVQSSLSKMVKILKYVFVNLKECFVYIFIFEEKNPKNGKNNLVN